MLPCVCSVIDRRWRQNVARIKKWRSKNLWLATKITPLSNLTQMASLGMKTCDESRTELRNLEILKKMLEKSSQFFVIRTALWAEKLGRCLEYCRSWKLAQGVFQFSISVLYSPCFYRVLYVNREKYNSPQLTANCIAAIRRLRYYVKLIWESPTTEDTNVHRR